MAFIVKSAVSMALLYALYYCCFRKETWFGLQRFYLLTALLASILISYADFSLPQYVPSARQQLPQFDIANFEFSSQLPATQHSSNTQYSWFSVLAIAYFTSVLLLITKYIVGLIKLLQLMKRYRSFSIGKYRLILVDNKYGTFSFWNTIFMAKSDFMSKNRKELFSHEIAHIRQWHTADLIIIELLRCVFWFNPCINLFIRSIKQVHEYLADEAAVQSPDHRYQYGTLLLSRISYSPAPALATSFSSHIQNRLLMISQIKSPKHSQLKLLLAVPVLSALLATYACTNAPVDTEPVPAVETPSESATVIKENLPTIFPISGTYTITSVWGTRMHPILKKEMHHRGLDIKAEVGTPVLAVADGIVSEIPDSFTQGKGYGRFIVIDHGNGIKSRYAQLSGYNTKIGQTVTAGQTIGYLGSSGISTGPHLHFELWRNGKDVDPQQYF